MENRKTKQRRETTIKTKQRRIRDPKTNTSDMPYITTNYNEEHIKKYSEMPYITLNYNVKDLDQKALEQKPWNKIQSYAIKYNKLQSQAVEWDKVLCHMIHQTTIQKPTTKPWTQNKVLCHVIQETSISNR